MNSVYELLSNSFLAWLFFSLESEVVWFSMLHFRQEGMLSATFLAFIASIAAYGVNYLLGKLLTRERENMPMSEETYAKGQRLVKRYVVWTLLFQWIPLLPAFSLIIAFFQPGIWRFFLAVIAGRLIYYLYYLQDAGLLMS